MSGEQAQVQVIPAPLPVEENHESVTISDDPEGCRTPTSDEHKIPSILRCPPAPKKRGKLKRKFEEQAFSGFTAGDEVDALFRSNFELFRVSSSRKVKWRKYN